MKQLLPCMSAACEALLDDPMACRFCAQALRHLEVPLVNERGEERPERADGLRTLRPARSGPYLTS